MNDKKVMEIFEKKLEDAIDKSIENHLKPIAESEAKEQTLKHIKQVVASLRVENAMRGFDRTGLSQAQKMEFAENVKSLFEGSMQKASQNTADPAAGGILIPDEVYAGIMRVAEDFGYVMKFAQKFPMAGTNQITIPSYQGAASSQAWEYLGQDTEGSETSVALKDALLKSEVAMRLTRIDNRILKKATVSLADWLIAIFAESLAYTIDNQAFNGIGAPFVGILNNSLVTTVTMGSGDIAATDVSADYLRQLVAAVRKGARKGGAFFMDLSVFNNLRNLKDSQGDYVFKANNNVVNFNGADDLLTPVGVFDGTYPVYDCGVLPASSAVGVSTEFIVFGNMRYLAFGEAGAMEIARSEHATVGSKSTFAAYQTAIRTVHEHGLVIANPQGFATLKTAAS